MALLVKPYKYSVVFFDSANQNIFSWSGDLDGTRDPPIPSIGSTFEILESGQDQYLGMVEDVRHFVTTDANNLTYSVTIVCRNSQVVANTAANA